MGENKQSSCVAGLFVWPTPIYCYTSRNKRVVAKTWQRLRFAVVSIQPDLESIICTSLEVVVQ